MVLGNGRWTTVHGFPHPIDTWALHSWNRGIAQARAHYQQLMTKPKWANPHMWLCSTCQRVRTNHHTRICWGCRYDTALRNTRGMFECTACGHHKTSDPTRLCGPCRFYQESAVRAQEWHDCVREGCHGVTRLAGAPCFNCRAGRAPKPVSHHWSKRFKP